MERSLLDCINVINDMIKGLDRQKGPDLDLSFEADKPIWDKAPYSLCDIWALKTLKKELLDHRNEAPLIVMEAFRDEMYSCYCINQGFMHAYQIVDECMHRLSVR